MTFKGRKKWEWDVKSCDHKYGSSTENEPKLNTIFHQAIRDNDINWKSIFAELSSSLLNHELHL